MIPTKEERYGMLEKTTSAAWMRREMDTQMGKTNGKVSLCPGK